MGIANLQKRKMREATDFLDGNASTMNLKKVRGKWVADITFGGTKEGWRSPAEVLAHHVDSDLRKACMSSDVRVTTFEPGTMIANLKDEEANRRSIAAMLARRYRRENQKLAMLYTAMRKRELSPKEVEDVMNIVDKLGKK